MDKPRGHLRRSVNTSDTIEVRNCACLVFLILPATSRDSSAWICWQLVAMPLGTVHRHGCSSKVLACTISRTCSYSIMLHSSYALDTYSLPKPASTTAINSSLTALTDGSSKSMFVDEIVSVSRVRKLETSDSRDNFNSRLFMIRLIVLDYHKKWLSGYCAALLQPLGLPKCCSLLWSRDAEASS